MNPVRLALIVLIIAPALPCRADDPATLLRDATLFGRFDTMQAAVDMEIHDRGVRSRTLAVVIDQSDSDTRKVLVQVTAPAFLNRMKYLSIRTPSGVDQWMSSSSGVRRIGRSSMNERLFDSDFTLEDFTPGISGEYAVRVVGTQTVDGEDCSVIEVVPHNPQSGYAMRRAYLSDRDGLLVRAEYFDSAGRLVKIMELLRRISIDGRVFPGAISMRSVLAETHTVLTVRSIELDDPIPARIFSRGAL